MDSWSNILKKTIVFTLLIIFFAITSAYVCGADFSIRFYDKKIYFPDSSIMIKAEITNTSSEHFSFKLAESRAFNLEFSAKTLKNRPVNPAEEYIIQRNPDQQVFYREITLAPGEQYSFIEDLTDFIEPLESGMYIVNAHFYPELNKSPSSQFIESNYLNLSIRPPAGVRELEAVIDKETGMILQKNPIPPNEVVEYFIQARQKSEWDKFFLYLDVESIMLRNPELMQKYRSLSDEKRREMVSEYKEQMKQEIADEVILLIPEEYSILKTEYTLDRGTVLAELKFRYPGYMEVKEYTYYLSRKDKIWYIYNYEVRNLGTE